MNPSAAVDVIDNALASRNAEEQRLAARLLYLNVGRLDIDELSYAWPESLREWNRGLDQQARILLTLASHSSQSFSPRLWKGNMYRGAPTDQRKHMTARQM